MCSINHQVLCKSVLFHLYHYHHHGYHSGGHRDCLGLCPWPERSTIPACSSTFCFPQYSLLVKFLTVSQTCLIFTEHLYILFILLKCLPCAPDFSLTQKIPMCLSSLTQNYPLCKTFLIPSPKIAWRTLTVCIWKNSYVEGLVPLQLCSEMGLLGNDWIVRALTSSVG
jgi:hypothetical protein